MNINNHLARKKKPLFEAEDLNGTFEPIPQNFQSQNIDKQRLQTVLTVKSKQFVFSCGAVMANIRYDTGNMLGLKYHADKSSSVDEFVDSVAKFIATTGETITDSDKQRLIREYSKR